MQKVSGKAELGQQARTRQAKPSPAKQGQLTQSQEIQEAKQATKPREATQPSKLKQSRAGHSNATPQQAYD